MKRIAPFLALTSILLTSIGCFSSDTSRRPSETSTIPGTTPRADGLEVTWDAGSGSVDGYIIRYGVDPQSLSEEVRVPVRDLRKDVDGEFGTVYRYVLRNVPQDTRVFVRIAAYRGKQISDFSDVRGELALK